MTFVSRFFFLVLLLSFGELYLLVVVSQNFSFGLTLLLCVLTGVVGGAMVRHQGLQTLRDIQRAMGRGEMPAREIGSGLILLLIGASLLTPGFITDTIGFLLLIPALRHAAVAVIWHSLKKRVQIVPGSGFGPAQPKGRVIDVELEKKE